MPPLKFFRMFSIAIVVAFGWIFCLKYILKIKCIRFWEDDDDSTAAAVAAVAR